jgi:hypothetical protein
MLTKSIWNSYLHQPYRNVEEFENDRRLDEDKDQEEGKRKCERRGRGESNKVHMRQVAPEEKSEEGKNGK